MTRKQLIELHEKTTQAARGLMQAKNSDYNADDEPLGNLAACEILGINIGEGILVRMLDKLKRMDSFAKAKDMQVSDEKIEDTVADLINYSILFLAWFTDSE